MKYIKYILILLPVALPAMTAEQALAEQELIAQEIKAIRETNPTATERCEAIKAWRIANTTRLNAINTALMVPVSAPVLIPLVVPEGSSAEEAACLTSSYQVYEAIFNLRVQYKDATAVERCEAIKAWSQANQSILDAVDQSAALQGSAPASYPSLVMPGGLTPQQQQAYSEMHALDEEIFNLHQQYKDATAVERCEAIKVWYTANKTRLQNLKTLMQSL